jgi:type II secretory pathway pseudopilin PulG
MVAVVIIGLLIVIAIPTFARIRRNAQNTRFISDLRTFAQAFEAYAMKTGTWPPNAGNGAVPTGMSGELNDASWKAVNSVGGRWNWDYKYNGITAGVSTVLPVENDDQMTQIDARIDDGNLGTGLFRKINGRYTYILQR